MLTSHWVTPRALAIWSAPPLSRTSGEPAGRRRIIEIIPGILATLFLWLAAASAFGRYLAEFSFTYVNTYAGLASAMIALVFLYWTATIFVYGGEFNAAHLRSRAAVKQADPALDNT